MTTSTKNGVSSREWEVDSHQFHMRSRFFLECASTKSFTGSSIISTRAPRPIKEPPGNDVLYIPPPSSVRQLDPFPPSRSSATPSPGLLSICLRKSRAHPPDSCPSQDVRAISHSGLRRSSHNEATCLTSRGFPDRAADEL